MKFGLDNKQFTIFYNLVVAPLKSYGAKVYVFGSRATGKNHPFSDIDILFEENPNQKIPQSAITKISMDAEESDLVVKVDLVKSSELAKSFSERVNAEKIEIK
jgi:predicted nucleotidyltransferase